jgi:hypothetical protein
MAVSAILNATRSIPIVFTWVSDPVGSGFDRERVPFIAFRVDPVALDLGFEAWEPEARLRDADGKPVI